MSSKIHIHYILNLSLFQVPSSEIYMFRSPPPKKNVKLYCLGLNGLTDTLTSAWDAMRVNFGVPVAASKPSQWGLNR